MDYKRYADLEIFGWNNSELRQWLNNDFYNDAFTDEEKKLMVDSVIKDNQGSKVSLISIDQAQNFARNNKAVCVPTAYAVQRSPYEDKTIDKDSCAYWIDGDGKEIGTILFVETNGFINQEGMYQTLSRAVRPKITLDLREIPDS